MRNSTSVLNDDEVTQLQFSIDALDLEAVRGYISRMTAEELTELQFYLNSTALMYACKRGNPELVKLFLDRGVTPFELPYSDNNELKSAVLNKKHALEITKMILDWLPADMRVEMVESDWDPTEGDGEEECLSALEIASGLNNEPLVKLLQSARY